jgi:hypothetical protein
VIKLSIFHVTKIEPSSAFREELERESFDGTCSRAWIVIPPTLEAHLGFLSLQMVNTPHGILTA